MQSARCKSIGARILAAVCLLSPSTAFAQLDESIPPRAALRATICDTLREAAAEADLPIDFFTRLIWQESRFDPMAVSPAGARGIAQFMPRTADWRGLADPFNAVESLHQSARYLRDLRAQFGNLGLAAAAYNGGSGRVTEWLAGRRQTLPAETRAYVRIVTGHSVEDWAANRPEKLEGDIPKALPCGQIANIVAAARAPARAAGDWAPWGVQLAGSFSEGQALAAYDRLAARFRSILGERQPLVIRMRIAGRGPARRNIIRMAEATRADAERLCNQLRRAGGACLVLRNPGGASAARREPG
jgi:hypothetical protein